MSNMYLFIVLHLVGLILFAGTTVVEFAGSGIQQQSASRFARIGGIGAAILILSGIGMMYLTRGLYGEQIWFRIKFGIVLLLILTSIISRRSSKKLQKRLPVYFILQCLFFLGILILSIYKFK